MIFPGSYFTPRQKTKTEGSSCAMVAQIAEFSRDAKPRGALRSDQSFRNVAALRRTLPFTARVRSPAPRRGKLLPAPSPALTQPSQQRSARCTCLSRLPAQYISEFLASGKRFTLLRSQFLIHKNEIALPTCVSSRLYQHQESPVREDGRGGFVWLCILPGMNCIKEQRRCCK